MTNLSRRSFILASGAMLAAAGAPPAVRGQVRPLVRVGALPLDTTGVVYYAHDLGMFAAAGLEVDLQAYSAAAQAAAAIAGGSLDVSLANVTTIAAGHLRGLDLRFIAPAAVATTATRTDVIAVAADTPYRKASDLNGKVVGIGALKSMQQVSALSWMERHGGDPASLKFVELPFPEMVTALAAHRVDAALVVEPFVTAGGAQIRSLGSVLDGVAPTFMYIGFFAANSWLAANVPIAERFVSTIRQAAVWANTHHPESAAILLRYTKLDPAIASTMARATYGTTLDAALVQPPIDVSAKYGIIERSFPAAEIVWNVPGR